VAIIRVDIHDDELTKGVALPLRRVIGINHERGLGRVKKMRKEVVGVGEARYGA
jgi:hypothetical protein